MKRISYIICLVLTAYVAGAQVKGFYVGGRLGLGESMLQCGGIANPVPKLAVSGGIATSYYFTKNFALNADFLLTSGGVHAQGTTTEKGLLGSGVSYGYKEKYDLVNAEVPVTGQLAIWFGDIFLRGYMGPAMNFKLLAVQTRTYENADYNDSHGFINKQLDQTNNIFYSMIYGIGIGAKTKNDKLFFLDLRTSRALTSLGTINSTTAFSNYYCISVGYEF